MQATDRTSTNTKTAKAAARRKAAKEKAATAAREQKQKEELKGKAIAHRAAQKAAIELERKKRGRDRAKRIRSKNDKAAEANRNRGGVKHRPWCEAHRRKFFRLARNSSLEKLSDLAAFSQKEDAALSQAQGQAETHHIVKSVSDFEWGHASALADVAAGYEAWWANQSGDEGWWPLNTGEAANDVLHWAKVGEKSKSGQRR